MKNIKYSLFILITLLTSFQTIIAQSDTDDIVFKAMNDELNSVMQKMVMENHKPPFYISYQLCRSKSLIIKASLGAILSSTEQPVNTCDVRLMVGDYSLNNENYGKENSKLANIAYIPIPAENDYLAIRRSLWIKSEEEYKKATQTYEQKLLDLHIGNGNRPDDYTKSNPLVAIIKGYNFNYEKGKWENIARDISSIFKEYPSVFASVVYVKFLSGELYLTTSEGSKIKLPINIASIFVNSHTQAFDNEPLNDHLFYFAPTPDMLPPIDTIKAQSKKLGSLLSNFRQAPVFEDAYTGPVIFEADAVGELFAQFLFNEKKGLISSRGKASGIEGGSDEQYSVGFENKIGLKILSDNITIKAIPKTKEFNKIPLIGSFDIDAEGVVPKDELMLVEKGVLKTLLSDRIPINSIKQSNGHKRFIINNSALINITAPGVIDISYDNNIPEKRIRKEVLKDAEKRGLEYIYVIRKLQVMNAGMNRVMVTSAARNLSPTKPVEVYRISVKTGEEQLVRTAIFNDLQPSELKNTSFGSSEKYVYQNVTSEIPVSYIVPHIIVMNEINLVKDKGLSKTMKPIVTQP